MTFIFAKNAPKWFKNIHFWNPLGLNSFCFIVCEAMILLIYFLADVDFEERERLEDVELSSDISHHGPQENFDD